VVRTFPNFPCFPYRFEAQKARQKPLPLQMSRPGKRDPPKNPTAGGLPLFGENAFRSLCFHSAPWGSGCFSPFSLPEKLFLRD